MKKEKYIARFENYKNNILSSKEHIRKLQKEYYELRNDYVEQFREFQNGDMVNVTYGHNQMTEKAFISHAEEYKGKIAYRFIQVKKDGKPSRRELYVSQYSWEPEIKIELLNTEYRNKNWDGSPITENQ